MMNIPTTLEECFSVLDETLSLKDRAHILDMQEDDLSQLHHGLGQWIRNNWNLWHDGPLKNYFLQFEITHADDMSSIIITSYHRFLNNKPLEIEDQVKKYSNYWKGLSINAEE